MSSIILTGLAAQGIIVKCRSCRGVAEEANGADQAGRARKVVKLELLICIKG